VLFRSPTATISGIASENQAAYPFIGANLYQSSKVDITNASASDNVTAKAYLLTYPNSTTIEVAQSQINTTVENLPVGTYKLGILFNYENFITGTDAKLFKTEPVTFTVVKDGEATITASVDQMNKGETFTITVTGQPGYAFAVNTTAYAFVITNGQPGISVDENKNNASFLMPNTGSVSFTLAGNQSFTGDNEQTIELFYNATGNLAGVWTDADESIKVKFAKGTLTAKTELASYFVGDSVKIIGTSTAGVPTTYKINGTNFGYQLKDPMTEGSEAGLNIIKVEGDSVKTFEFFIDANLKSMYPATDKMMDVGTYTITLTAGGVNATIPLVLKQPFISIIEAPEVIVQGEDEVEFIINAEATDKIYYYIFGTNYFTYKEETENVEDEEGEDIENQFIVELTESQTKAMATGQYFAVFQHPMYDGEFNITADSNWNIILNALTAPSTLFNVKDRQTANAAQALCDALDTQNIDDMYVKYSFFVVGEDESFTISEIPTSVAQGETITISGVSTANADNTVTVEMISTAFAAVPKETVGSAAFILVTTEVAEDGTWEVTLDTSDLNVDEYSLSVAIDNVPKKTVTVNVVEGAETPDTPDTPDVPDTPDTPDTPTEPTTPGFGALAALAGLGAVAVLLLRRE
ncbi:MAG: PGF-CTERM sorting domain-containing protein, partial [Methanocorpusculaceae archaeon]|nr:PGF-CTERM sorting domain-containing protein [Methanocorpusculaceae archaeon]